MLYDDNSGVNHNQLAKKLTDYLHYEILLNKLSKIIMSVIPIQKSHGLNVIIYIMMSTQNKISEVKYFQRNS